MTLFLALVVATFVSEDLACVAAGLLSAGRQIDPFPAIAACLVGVVLGDVGVWLVGRKAAGWGWVRRRLPDARRAELSGWLGRHGGKAAVAARFLPGTRVPLLLASGVARTGGRRVLFWSAVAAVAWVPIVVLSVSHLGRTVSGWWVLLGFAALLFGPRAVVPLFTRIGRAKLFARVAKLWRWEFWPAWVFYLPWVPWFLYLAARYRSLTVWTAANPGIPAGGVVGESKADILAKLPADAIVPTLLIPPGDHGCRVALLRGCSFPLVLKPDAGQRGAGVKKVHDAVDAEKYLLANRGAVVAQQFHPGPFEAGVFYFRLPGEERGRVFSITDKVFPVLTGDGRSTLEELIWAHPRFRMQAATFLARHAAGAGRVLADGEQFPLALAGNHCQGTMFCDGTHLLTPELEAAFDRAAKAFDGFFVGRFDVRYSDPAEFRAGRGFAVVELNGVTSESTNLYDPSWSLVRAYRTLFRQWSLLFRVGDANRRRGHRPVSVRRFLSLVRSHYRDRDIETLSD
jgi:membrane protein DedA with SNARE-associated domain